MGADDPDDGENDAPSWLARFAHGLARLANPALASLRLRSDGSIVARGDVPAPLLGDCADVVRAFALRRGTIDVIRRDGRLQLRFCPHVPARAHQRFRNVFGAFLASRSGRGR